MPHLNRIGLTNFRVFGEKTDIALAPITILTGTNSSGKSSVLKAFQLLQENIKDIGNLNFSEGEHKLGNFELALNRQAKNKTITFTLPIEFRFNRDNFDNIYADLVYQLDSSNDLKFGKLIRISICLEKNKHEIIGVIPWDSIDIDFEYFHRNRFMNYNLELLKLYPFFLSRDTTQSLEELRMQSADFLIYSKPAKELVKKIYESADDALRQKLLNFFEVEFPKDFDLFQVCEEYMVQIKSFEESITKEKLEHLSNQYSNEIGSFLIDLPEPILKRQIELIFNVNKEDDVWEIINPTSSRRNQKHKPLNQKEFVDYVFSTLLSVKEKLRQKYNFENDQELSFLFFDDIMRGERDRYEGFCGMIRSFLTIGEENGQGKADLSGFLQAINAFHSNYFFIGKDNTIIKDFFYTLYNEDQYNILIKKIFGDNLDNIEKSIGIYSKVEKILKDAFEEKSYNNLLSIFKKNNFHYLEAVRANTQRLYTFQSQGTSFNELILNFIKKNNETQIFYINEWLKELGIANELKVEVNSQGIGASISIDGQSLADLGYGVTQLLPILIRLATITEYIWQAPDPDNKNGWGFYGKRILYIEEPETNLHPKLQSKLADILVEACETMKIQLIIETHSEYLIRKLQYLTAKKIISPEMTVIHYFYDPKEERPEGEPQIKQINIQTDGRLTGQFGTGFYDESARLMTAILTGETLN